jgi:hypothetical protein
MARRAQWRRVHSDVTQEENFIEGKKTLYPLRRCKGKRAVNCRF